MNASKFQNGDRVVFTRAYEFTNYPPVGTHGVVVLNEGGTAKTIDAEAQRLVLVRFEGVPLLHYICESRLRHAVDMPKAAGN